ncbi:hypothetical protein ElyMa_001398300 [Elysia marginata]|uniref:Uncharacterized protein n=1 Tax=Elysia marginata TaxID=1093978 RepID=A0AAV4IUY6_9GAST|nr:hypothetical protein ElyMa_001398300 [Elysia marginata]
MAKVLFVIRLPAHENDLRGRHNTSFTDAFPGEDQQAKDRNENQKDIKGDNIAPNNTKEDSVVPSNTTNKIETGSNSGCEENEKPNASQDPGWDFGDCEQSGDSTTYSTAESSPSKTPGENNTGSKESTVNAAEETNAEQAGIATQETPNRQEDINMDLKPEIVNAGSNVESLSAESKEKNDDESVDANENTAVEKVDGGDEENVAQSNPEYIRFVSQEMTLLEVSIFVKYNEKRHC